MGTCEMEMLFPHVEPSHEESRFRINRRLERHRVLSQETISRYTSRMYP